MSFQQNDFQVIGERKPSTLVGHKDMQVYILTMVFILLPSEEMCIGWHWMGIFKLVKKYLVTETGGLHCAKAV